MCDCFRAADHDGCSASDDTECSARGRGAPDPVSIGFGWTAAPLRPSGPALGFLLLAAGDSERDASESAAGAFDPGSAPRDRFEAPDDDFFDTSGAKPSCCRNLRVDQATSPRVNAMLQRCSVFYHKRLLFALTLPQAIFA